MNEYQQRLESFLLGAKLSPEYDISFKSVFGARAAYANGRIFATLGKFGFALKLPSDVCSELFDNGQATPLKYFANGHVKRGYAVVDEDHAEVQSRLSRLIVQSVIFAQADEIG